MVSRTVMVRKGPELSLQQRCSIRCQAGGLCWNLGSEGGAAVVWALLRFCLAVSYTHLTLPTTPYV